jgi:hypothetical protein
MRSLRFSWKYALVILGVLGLGYLVMDMNTRLFELRKNTILKEEVGAEATRLVNTQNALHTQIAFATSDLAVEQWAREDGHMVRSGDSAVVPIGAEGATAVPTPAPVASREVVQNWQMWLWLFVDSRE